MTVDSLYARLIQLGAAILAQRHGDERINKADAKRQDDALAALGYEARAIADGLSGFALVEDTELKAVALEARHHALKEGIAAIEQLRDQHCASTQTAKDAQDHCHAQSLDCDFVVAWNDAAELLRTLGDASFPLNELTEAQPADITDLAVAHRSQAGDLDGEEQELCDLLRAKMAKAIPREHLVEFQQWVTLEQSLCYARGRNDSDAYAKTPGQFEPSNASNSAVPAGRVSVPNPHTAGVAHENWRRGYEGERFIGPQGSAAHVFYKQGVAARKSSSR